LLTFVNQDYAACVAQEAVSNVLDNALKYVRASAVGATRPAVTVTLEARRASVAVVVRDTGNGFDENELEFVFARGFRGRASGAGSAGAALAAAEKSRAGGGTNGDRRHRGSRSRGRGSRSSDGGGDESGAAAAVVVAVGGSGLGLAIARDLMRAAGGEVVAANDPLSGGAVVTITAPRA
jgi:signal transduction histidine kinase